jgi:hypothetical protein
VPTLLRGYRRHLLPYVPTDGEPCFDVDGFLGKKRWCGGGGGGGGGDGGASFVKQLVSSQGFLHYAETQINLSNDAAAARRVRRGEAAGGVHGGVHYGSSRAREHLVDALLEEDFLDESGEQEGEAGGGSLTYVNGVSDNGPRSGGKPALKAEVVVRKVSLFGGGGDGGGGGGGGGGVGGGVDGVRRRGGVSGALQYGQTAACGSVSFRTVQLGGWRWGGREGGANFLFSTVQSYHETPASPHLLLFDAFTSGANKS